MGKYDHSLQPGDRVQITFAEPGEYHYVGSYRAQDIKGIVLVTAP